MAKRIQCRYDGIAGHHHPPRRARDGVRHGYYARRRATVSTFHNVVCLILIAAGLGIAVLLIPGNDELALLRFKDKEYEVARHSYEERLNSGDRSVDVIVPLTQLYLQ